MTFKENEHVNILEKIFKLSTESLPINKILAEVERISNRIPLYPGLVANCMNSLTENVKFEDTNVGDYVSIIYDNETISGTIAEKTPDGFLLTDTTITRKVDSFFITKKPKQKKIIKLNRETLEKSWPTLVFDKKKDNTTRSQNCKERGEGGEKLWLKS